MDIKKTGWDTTCPGMVRKPGKQEEYIPPGLAERNLFGAFLRHEFLVTTLTLALIIPKGRGKRQPERDVVTENDKFFRILRPSLTGRLPDRCR